jgi:putative signal transducing protein
MAYCPQCLTEYREDATECMDCRVALVPGAPPTAARGSDEPNAKLVRLRTFSGPTAQLDAGLAKNILATQGIPCVLPGEAVAEMLPGVDAVQLLVREEDAVEAAEILKSYLDTPAQSFETLSPPEK